MNKKSKENGIEFEDLSSYSSSKDYKRRRRNKPLRIVLKSILALFSVALIVGGSLLIHASEKLFSGLSTVDFTKDREELGIKLTATNDDSIKNIAFFGVDSRDGSFEGLSDAIMVLTVDNKHDKIKMTSILRDTRIDDIEDVGTEKINAAYHYGGAKLAIKTINQNFDLNIEDYVTINFYNLATVVDAFGGAEITMTDEEAYYTNENLNALMYEQIHDGFERTIWESDFLPSSDGYVTGGVFTLNGNQAVAYARNRSDSDSERSNRQKKVLVGLFERLKNMGTTEYFPLLQRVLPLCETSMGLDDAWNCAPIILKKFSIQSLTIPGEEEAAFGGDLHDGVGWHYSYDLELAAQHIDRFIYESDSAYWTGTPEDTEVNFSDEPGLTNGNKNG